VASRKPITQRFDSARRRDASSGADAARRAEANTPPATTSSRRDLDSARKMPAADSAGSARADAWTEIDGSRLVNKSVTLAEINDEGLTKAHEAFVQWNVDKLKRLLPQLPYAEKQVAFYWAMHCRGVCMLHYPPSSESGPKTNLSFNVHKTRTKEDEHQRIIYKLKSSCMFLSACAIAHWTFEPAEDKYACQELYVSDVDGTSRPVWVDNRSALALDFDHLEMFPTFDDNKVKIKKALQDKYGNADADAYMTEAGKAVRGARARAAGAGVRHDRQETAAAPVERGQDRREEAVKRLPD